MNKVAAERSGAGLLRFMDLGAFGRRCAVARRLTALASALFLTLSTTGQAMAAAFPFTGGAGQASTTGSVNTVGASPSLSVIANAGSSFTDNGANNELTLNMANGDGGTTFSNLRGTGLTINNTANSTNHAGLVTFFGSGNNGPAGGGVPLGIYLTGTNSLADNEVTATGGRGAALYGNQSVTSSASNSTTIDSSGGTTSFTGNHGIFMSTTGSNSSVVTSATDTFTAITGSTGSGITMETAALGNTFIVNRASTTNQFGAYGMDIRNTGAGAMLIHNSGAMNGATGAMNFSSAGGGLQIGFDPTLASLSGLTGAMTGGITATNTTGGITIVTATGGTINTATTTSAAGISASVTGASAIAITTGAAITASGAAVDGIITSVGAGAANTSITANADITAGRRGIDAAYNAGGMTITVGSGATVTGATNGIRATGSGIAFLNINGRVSGNVVTGAGGDGITLTSSATATDGVVTGTIDAGGGANSLNLAGTSTTITQDASKVLNVATINKSGTGTWTLSGTSTINPSYSITGGTLAISDNANLGTGTAAIVLNGGTLQSNGTVVLANGRNITLGASGGTLNMNSGSLVVPGTVGGAALTIAGTGIVELSGANTYSGGTTITGSLFLGNNNTAAGSGAVTLSGGKLSSKSGSTLTVANTININTAGGSIGANGETFTLSGIIQNGTGAGLLTLTDTGTVVLSGVNTYTGGTTVSAGKVKISAESGLGNTAGRLTLNGGTLDITSGPITLTRPVTIGASGGTIDSTGWSGGFSGTIDGPGTLTIAGGTITLTGANSYGATVVNSGALSIGGGGTTGTLGTGAVTNNAGMLFNRTDAVTVGNAISGTGSFSAATGSVTLTAVSTYTGSTGISAGATLALSGSGSVANSITVNDLGTFDISATTLGASIIDLQNSGSVTLGTKTLTITNAASTFSGGFNGSGEVILQGGTMTLTGNNLNTGTVTVGGGTLALSGAGSLAAASNVAVTGIFDITAVTPATASIKALSGAGTVNMGAKSLVITGGLGTFAGTITGTGGFSLTGGTTILSGASTYTGATTVASGATLQFGAGGTTGSIASLVTNNGTVAFNRSDTLTFPGTITGGGNLTQAGTGTLVVTSTNSFGAVTISAGTLQVGNGGTSGSIGSGAVTDNGRLTFNRTDAVTISNVISGTGGLTQGGTGNLILTGTSAYTGTTLVNSGILSVNGSIASSAVTVNTGGTLGGTGTTGAVTVASGGGIAPGNSIGTITVGSLTLAAGSTTTIEVSPAAADRINAIGAASLNGTLALAPAAGTYGATTYRLIQAGSLTGTFSSVTGSVAGFTNTLQYSPTAVDFILSTPAAAPAAPAAPSAPAAPAAPVAPVTITYLFGAYGNTPNQIAAGNGLFAASPTSALYLAMGSLVASNTPAVGPTFGILAGDIRPSLRAAAIDDSRLVRNILLDHMNRDGAGTVVWGAGFGGYGSIATDGNAAALHHDSGGFLAGVDLPVLPRLRLGVAGGYSANSARTTGRLSTASGDQGHIGAYAAFNADAVSFNLGGDYGFGKVNIVRAISQLGQLNSGSQDQQTGQVFADLGYLFPLQGATLQPHVTLAHVIATGGGFTETGGTSALSGAERSDSLTYATLGLRAALLDIKLDEYDLIPRLDLGWQHALSRLTPGQAVTYQNSNTSFVVLGTPLAQDAAAVQAGVELKTGPLSLFLSYDGALASRADSHGFRGGLDWRF